MTPQSAEEVGVQREWNGRKIKTAHEYLPIPVRCFDWAAWFDDVGEEGLNGNGATEQEAIADLIEQQEATE